jgi:hypothetical protein
MWAEEWNGKSTLHALLQISILTGTTLARSDLEARLGCFLPWVFSSPAIHGCFARKHLSFF